MKSSLRSYPGRIGLAVTILLIVVSGCQWPLSPAPAGTLEGTLAPEDRIPPAVRTEVAATLFASIAASPTTEPDEPQAAAPTQTPTQPPESTTVETTAPSPMAAITASPTMAATSASQPTSMPSATVQEQSSGVVTLAPGPYNNQPVPAQTVYPLPTYNPPQPIPTYYAPQPMPTYYAPQPMPTYYAPPYPPQNVYPGASGGFTIGSVNMPSCGGATAANFLISNYSGYRFESFNLTITDLNTGVVIFGPATGNAPFMYDDRACIPGGISYLDWGYSLFSGAPLNTPTLRGHTLHAAFVFCSADNLSGRCYSRSVQFVAP